MPTGVGADEPPVDVFADAEVVVCAGSINTPQLLELSGIGDSNILRGVGIDTNQHLPGVGRNLIDHLQVRSTYECSRPITINDVLRNPLRGAKVALEYALFRRGLMATPTVTVHALMRSGPEQSEPDLKIRV